MTAVSDRKEVVVKCKRCGVPVKVSQRGYHWTVRNFTGKPHKCKG